MSKYPITVTLNAIRACNPCETGWKTLLRGLGRTRSGSRKLPLAEVLRTNGLPDSLWCLRALPREYLRDIRLFMVTRTRQVQHLMTDPRSVQALDVAEKYANGLASNAELRTARAAAFAVYCVSDEDAAYAAYAATSVDRIVAVAAFTPVNIFKDEVNIFFKDEMIVWQAKLFIKMCNGTAPWQVQMEDGK